MLHIHEFFGSILNLEAS